MTKKTTKPPAVLGGVLNLKTIADLAADPKNPRKITSAALEGLKTSISEYGDLSGIVFNRRTGHLIAGHQRLRSMREKYGELPIQEEGGAYFIELPGGKRFQIRIEDWSLEKQRAANLVANNPAIAGTFTDDLQAQLAQVEADDAELFAALRLDSLVEAGKAGDSEEAEEVEIRAFKKTHVLVSFPPDLLIEVQEHLDAIRQLDGVEIEIGSN